MAVWLTRPHIGSQDSGCIAWCMVSSGAHDLRLLACIMCGRSSSHGGPYAGLGGYCKDTGSDRITSVVKQLPVVARLQVVGDTKGIQLGAVCVCSRSVMSM
jgi:hypothetical protein